MRPKGHIAGDGFIHDLMPLMKNGLVILRSILDILIERIEEAQEDREIDVRKDTYESIISALETEIENIRTHEGDTPSADGKIEIIEAVISVLSNEMEELEKHKPKKDKRPRKVTID